MQKLMASSGLCYIVLFFTTGLCVWIDFETAFSDLCELRLVGCGADRRSRQTTTMNSAMVAAERVEENQLRRGPAWLRPLLAARFFTPCGAHSHMSRNECRHYCLDCAGAGEICAYCVHGRTAAHAGHRVVQVRRSSYHSVVKVSELEAVIDLSNVQTYVINADRVVFLNERPQAPRNGRCAAAATVACSACEQCGRGLLDVAFRFCSLGCKLRRVEWDDTLTLAIDPSHVAEPQVYGNEAMEDAAEGEEKDERPGKQQKIKPGQSTSSSSRARTGGERVSSSGGDDNGKEEEEEEQATAKVAALVPVPAVDPHSHRRRPRKGVHRAPERAPFS
ncbi:hypothetical protein GUJ93_ZPchr0002g25544 [Zizania palustris]|uniref:PLATZ transcription factor family protein n=1 Tax=Zizania palustris TaxID=103762 RepID=A0A8J5S1U3_ZIZPA|nr:hypothetical protein GUJ93_ZPchr0002g25544 [Zizania palustris]